MEVTMNTLTEDGFMRYSHESVGDAMHIFLGVLFEFEQNNWDFQPHYYMDRGQLCKEKYVLSSPEGQELLRSINSIDDLYEVFPSMYVREFGETAANAFPISKEIMEEALALGYIYIY
jgi:hypothetical protein